MFRMPRIFRWIRNKFRRKRMPQEPQETGSHYTETILDDLEPDVSQGEYRQRLDALRQEHGSYVSRNQQQDMQGIAGQEMANRFAEGVDREMRNHPESASHLSERPERPASLRERILENAHMERRLITSEEIQAIRIHERAERNHLGVSESPLRNSLTTPTAYGIIEDNEERQEDNMPRNQLWFDMLRILRRDGDLCMHLFEAGKDKPKLKVELSPDELVCWLWIAYTGGAYVEDRTNEFGNVRELISNEVDFHDMQDDIARTPEICESVPPPEPSAFSARYTNTPTVTNTARVFTDYVSGDPF